MTTKSILKDIFLSPFSWIYGIGVALRNWMFDTGVLPTTKFDTPVIAVGNLSAGGTGKTPMTEYLISVLKENFRIAVVSRGYKRKTSGYVLASGSSKPTDIGDEPYQMKRKFPDLILAVDASRTRAIKKLLESELRPELFLLDDAYQHRYVSPDISILLVDYNNLIYKDKLLPVGTLREPVRAKDRATIVVVTKCPADISPMNLRVIKVDLKLYPYQDLYFTTTKYDEPKAVFNEGKKTNFGECDAITVTGIAKPAEFEKHVEGMTKSISVMRFSDHHNFSASDYAKIKEKFDSIDDRKKVIFTTEKDAVRIMNDASFPSELKQSIFYIPVKVRFIRYDERDEQTFNTQIINYVTKNRNYMRLSQK